MKYYSEKLKAFYDTPDACDEAEEKFEKEQAEKEAKKKALKEERAARAAEVENAYKASVEATKNYQELLNKFVKDFGSFHMTLKTGDFNPFDGFDHFFKTFWL